MTAIRPYVKPLTRREPPAPKPTPMTPNAAWLDACAAYWVGRGYVLHWTRDVETGCYGFSVWDAERGMFITHVTLFE